MGKSMTMFRSAILLTAVNLMMRMVGTSFQVYLSASIGAAGIGLLQLVLSVGGLAMVVGMGGIRTATMYLCAGELGRKKPGSIRWILSGCIGYSILFSGTTALVLYHFAPEIARFWIGDSRILPALRLFAAFLPCVCLTGVISGYFTAANRIGTLAALGVAEQLVSMALTMTALGLWAGNDPSRACLCVVLGSSLGGCLTLSCLVLLRLREKPPKGPRIPVTANLCRTALPLALADDMRTGISTLENLMVPKRLALNTSVENPLAAFGTLSGMVFPVLMFPACILFGLAELLIPELARCHAAGSRGRIRYLMKRSLKAALLYGTLFSGLLFLLAHPLSMALYDNQEAGTYLRLYALLIPMLYCDAITDAMIKGLGQQTASVRYNIFTNVLDVVFLYLLLPRYGMAGYFFSFLVTHIINFSLSLRRLLKITGARIPLSIPLRVLAAMAGALGIASVLSSPIARAGVFPVLLVSMLYLLQILHREDLLWARGLLRQ